MDLVFLGGGPSAIPPRAPTALPPQISFQRSAWGRTPTSNRVFLKNSVTSIYPTRRTPARIANAASITSINSINFCALASRSAARPWKD